MHVKKAEEIISSAFFVSARFAKKTGEWMFFGRNNILKFFKK
jgi:hypothetical protein